MSKYANRRTVYAGYRFDSRAEADYARLLDLRKAAGQIRDWDRGAKIVLVPGDRKHAISYWPDFDVTENDGTVTRVEVKGGRGVVTAVAKLKLKLLRHVRPDIRLLVVDADGQEMDL